MADRKKDVGGKATAGTKEKEKKVRRNYEQPNEETIAAIEEGRKLLKSKEPGYKTITALMKALGV